MNIIKAVVNWFVFSSKNPEKFSMTLKGLVPLAVLVGFGPELMNETSNTVVDIVVQSGTIVTGAVTLWGAVRKLYFLFKK